MTSPAQEGCVLTAVSPADGEPASRLVALLGELVRRAGCQPGAARVLGPNAAEIALPAEIPDKSALGALDPLADWALLPARHRRKRLLVCDMDSTIIGQECIDELADYAGIKAQIAAITEAAMRGELDFENALKTRVLLLKGLPLDTLDTCWHERIRLNPGARRLTATMAAHGARCLLVSGGFTAFTGRVAREAGFHADQANQLLDDGRALTGFVREPILGRDAKREALETERNRLGLDPAQTLAIGDGANDLAMIRVAGLGLAYRAKPVVAAEADAAIRLTDLTTALYFQGYCEADFVVPQP